MIDKEAYGKLFAGFAVKSRLNFSSINKQWPKENNGQQRKLPSKVKVVNYEVREMTEAPC